MTSAPPAVKSETAPGKTHAWSGAAIVDAPHPDVDAARAKVEGLAALPGYPARGSAPVCALVPVKNEQANVVECLRRLQWCEQVTVIDSQSTDDTIALSQAMDAEVYQFHYDRTTGWPKKKNWALENVPWKHEWILIVDADEHITPELAQEIAAVVRGDRTPDRPGCGDGYWINRRFMFLGRWLKYGGWYPSWNLRLFRHPVGRYERIGNLGDTGSGDNEVHEHPVLLTGEAGYLEHDMEHYAYPDLSVWIEKHNRYTTWEAHALRAKDEGGVKPRLFGGSIERRRWLKKHGRKLPFRSVIRFLFDYVIRRGALDGYPGFVMAINMAWYEFMSNAKSREMQIQERIDARRREVDGGG
ncbi:MAG: glycosyltransferase family 2 protein [Phycisphaerales bacterium]|jgi:glycosyltransferase involved in cell wall biosynthesis